MYSDMGNASFLSWGILLRKNEDMIDIVYDWLQNLYFQKGVPLDSHDKPPNCI